MNQVRLTIGKLLLGCALSIGTFATSAIAIEDVSTIDILTLYTPAMRDYYGGENGAVARSIELVEVANEGFENSGLTTRLRLVGTELVDYVEDQDEMGTDLDRLKDDDDGFADGIHEQRENHGADLVALLRDGGTDGTAGIAYMLDDLNGDPEWAFSVTEAQGSNSWHAFTHEIGHNLGGAHDRVAASGPGLFDYSYGHHIDSLEVMTIMSYQKDNEDRVPYFSNPSINYMGYPLGVSSSSPDSADNAKTINLSTPIVAAYRKSLPTIPEFGQHQPVRYVKFGSNITLQSRAVGLPEISLQWYRGFKGDKGEPLGTSQLQETGPINEPSVFWLEATNSQGKAVSETIALIPSDNYAVAESVAIGEEHTVNYYVDDSAAQSFSVGEDMRVIEELRLRMRKRGTVPDLRITLSDTAGRILIQETLSDVEIENALNGNWLSLVADAGFAVEAGETFELELSLLGEHDSENYVSWFYEESSTSGLADSYTMEIIGTKNAGPFIAISPTSASLTSESGVLDVQINSDGEWQIVEDSDWIASSGSTGSGSQEVSFYYDLNSGTNQRTLEVIIGTEILTVEQTPKRDTDGDGIFDSADLDDDNDGVPDSIDAFPLNPNETIDTDGDGVGNNADVDDDNDGVYDTQDVFPLDPSENLDSDGDGTGNNKDTDDDGDGYVDTFEDFAGADSLDSTDAKISENFAKEMALPILDMEREKGINEVTSSPSNFNLYTESDLIAAEASSRLLGQRDVIESPESYELATLAQIDAAAEAARTIVNVSARVALGEGELVTPGFVVLGEQKKMLIRAVGPKLADLGVGSPLPNPTMTVYKSRWDGNPPDVVATIDDWKADNENVAEILTAMSSAGAFPLEPAETFQGRPFMTNDTRSAAVLVTLDVGLYTVQVSSADEGTGEVLVEVYEVTE